MVPADGISTGSPNDPPVSVAGFEGENDRGKGVEQGHETSGLRRSNRNKAKMATATAFRQ